MDSDHDIRDLIRNLVSKIFKSEEINDEVRNVKIGEGEMDTICNYIFSDISELSSPIINQDFVIDLELFEGLGTDRYNSVYSNINLTKTNLGSFLLKKILENPTTQTKLLESRQSVIKKIVKDKKLKEELDEKLDILKKNELDILYLWKVWMKKLNIL